MALISPGVQVTVSDESQYTPTAAGSIAYVLVATAQDKINPSGAVATGTTIANSERIITVTSPRELVSLFGTPTFKTDAGGNPIHASEQNEYGLLAAYSALSASNRMYVQRANVDLDQLTGTSIRPTGEATDGTYWLDLDNTNFGIFSWDAEGPGFNAEAPIVITDEDQLTTVAGVVVPIQAVGRIGDYAVDVTTTKNRVYYKGFQNRWSLVGTDNWKANVPVITSQIANNSNLSVWDGIQINGEEFRTGATTMTGVASAINVAMTGKGVTARVNTVGQLEIFADGTAASSGNLSLPDGRLYIAKGTAFGYANVE